MLFSCAYRLGNKKRETANAVSLLAGCAYTPAVVDESGLAPESYTFCQSFLHTYSAFNLTPRPRRTGDGGRIPLKLP